MAIFLGEVSTILILFTPTVHKVAATKKKKKKLSMWTVAVNISFKNFNLLIYWDTGIS